MPLYCVDKPLGLTSHDVVARARRLLGTRRVGHAGTLDPLASGVLLVMSHEATKLSQFLTGHDKSYLAWVRFGAATPTLDAEGPVSETASAWHVDAAAIRAALPPFLTLSEQRPPAYSAIKRQGERSYAAARRGAAEEPPVRPAAYRSVELLALGNDFADLPQRFAPAAPAAPGAQPRDWSPAPAGRTFTLPAQLPAAGPVALLALRVAAGTYVRAFARDLGTALGVPAHLAGLVRTSSGRLDLSRATPLDELPSAAPVAPRDALELPALNVDAATATAIARGQRPPLTVARQTALWGPDGELVAVIGPHPERGFGVVRVFDRGA